MALKTFVKISNVNNLTDARYCAGMYVDLLGFCVEPSQANYVSPDRFKEITSWLSGPEYVAEFRTSDPEVILQTLEAYEGISYLQVDDESLLPLLEEKGYRILLRKTINEVSELEELRAAAKRWSDKHMMLLLESDRFEQITGDLLLQIRQLTSACEVILGFGLHPTSILELLEQTGAKGISLSGGQEIKPGLKDLDELSDILEALEED